MSFFDETPSGARGAKTSDTDARGEEFVARINAIFDEVRRKLGDAAERDLRARQKALGEIAGYLLGVHVVAPWLFRRAWNRTGLPPIDRRQARAVLSAVSLLAGAAAISARQGQRNFDDAKRAVAVAKGEVQADG